MSFFPGFIKVFCGFCQNLMSKFVVDFWENFGIIESQISTNSYVLILTHEKIPVRDEDSKESDFAFIKEVYACFVNVDMWLVGIYLSGAAVFDLWRRRIPNWWSLTAVAAGLVVRLWFEQPSGEVVGYLVRMLIVIACFFPFYIVRMLGAGDVKMMAIVIGYLGFPAGIRVTGWAFLVGAVWGVVKMLWQHSLWRRLSILRDYVRRLILTREIVPYYQAERDAREGVIPFAVCLLLGFLANYIW